MLVSDLFESRTDLDLVLALLAVAHDGAQPLACLLSLLHGGFGLELSAAEGVPGGNGHSGETRAIASVQGCSHSNGGGRLTPRVGTCLTAWADRWYDDSFRIISSCLGCSRTIARESRPTEDAVLKAVPLGNGELALINDKLGHCVVAGVLVAARHDVGRSVRDAEVEDLSSSDEVVEALHDLLARRRVLPPLSKRNRADGHQR